ncbi:LacI family DNA-binding transcriptional regulator [Actinomyces sp.]|uniref:LacI family DNA-binding transcriptional regulator n=1 Tax=Actinomyces sp. TaxID=29317 RepID=UPI0026DC0ABA|nr:substrate-binding domain-containing protein [Actinomyces sp.]MDO4901677.1 substrate-binding domain-containing protein [Actinomyces sp.]
MKTVTLKDVAAAAGVSTSTASRILDERLPASRSASAQRVREAAARLGYRRDAAASALRRGDTRTVGVLVPRLSDTVMALLFEAIYAEAASRGRFALVSVCGDDSVAESRAVDSLLARRVDGLVLATARLDDPLPGSLREHGVPHVLALRTDGVSPSSVCDDELGGYLATRHLIDLGHTAVAVLPGPDFTSTARQRLAGYQRAMAEAGLPVPDAYIRHCGFGFTAGREAATAVLAQAPELTAVFAANDSLAMGTLSAAEALGRSVPEGLSVVGYNDTPLAGQLAVPLTTVRVPFDLIAVGALDLLAAQTGGDDSRIADRVAAPTLIPRRSATSLAR